MDDLKVRPLPVEQPWFEHLPVPQDEKCFSATIQTPDDKSGVLSCADIRTVADAM
jgi:hypothetical protein